MVKVAVRYARGVERRTLAAVDGRLRVEVYGSVAVAAVIGVIFGRNFFYRHVIEECDTAAFAVRGAQPTFHRGGVIAQYGTFHVNGILRITAARFVIAVARTRGGRGKKVLSAVFFVFQGVVAQAGKGERGAVARRNILRFDPSRHTIVVIAFYGERIGRNAARHRLVGRRDNQNRSVAVEIVAVGRKRIGGKAVVVVGRERVGTAVVGIHVGIVAVGAGVMPTVAGHALLKVEVGARCVAVGKRYVGFVGKIVHANVGIIARAVAVRCALLFLRAGERKGGYFVHLHVVEHGVSHGGHVQPRVIVRVAVAHLQTERDRLVGVRRRGDIEQETLPIVIVGLGGVGGVGIYIVNGHVFV